MAEYGGSEWREMIDHWHTVLRFSRASNVSMFYAHRHSTFEHVQSGTKQVKLQDKDYEW